MMIIPVTNFNSGALVCLSGVLSGIGVTWRAIQVLNESNFETPTKYKNGFQIYDRYIKRSVKNTIFLSNDRSRNRILNSWFWIHDFEFMILNSRSWIHDLKITILNKRSLIHDLEFMILKFTIVNLRAMICRSRI